MRQVKSLALKGDSGCAGTFYVCLCALSLALSLSLSACGYQFRVEGAGPTIGGAETGSSSTAPPLRLVVRTLENRTFEPNLETRYTNYLRHEFSSGSGAQIVPDSEAADWCCPGKFSQFLFQRSVLARPPRLKAAQRW